MRLVTKYCVVSINRKSIWSEGDYIEAIDEITRVEFLTENECEQWIVDIINSAINIQSIDDKIYHADRNGACVKDLTEEFHKLESVHRSKFSYWRPEIDTEMRIVKKFCLVY